MPKFLTVELYDKIYIMLHLYNSYSIYSFHKVANPVYSLHLCNYTILYVLINLGSGYSVHATAKYCEFYFIAISDLNIIVYLVNGM